MRQFELQAGATYLVCWLDDDARLKEGARLTVKETDERVWTVRKRYRVTRDVNAITEGRKWRVGGLS